MRIFKSLFIGVLIIFIVITAIGLLFPSTIQVSRAINIKAPSDSIYHYLADAKYWKLWIDGARENELRFLSSKTAGAGTVVKMGTNEVSIEKVAPKLIETNWKSSNGEVQKSGFVMINEVDSSVTMVQWYFEQHLKWYPWQRFGSMMMDRVLGPAMEKSLVNLKTLVEEKSQLN